MPDATRLAALRTAVTPSMLRRSLAVAGIVGTVLNLINQGDVVLAGGALDWAKVGLTYCVPFCVSTYGAYSAAGIALGRLSS